MLWQILAFNHHKVETMGVDELKSELQELKDEKYHLLKLINHDVRSPFNRLFALLQLLELDGDDFSDQQVEYIDSMYLSILSGLEMIQNLRDMREIDAGFVEISKATFELDELISGAMRSFSKQIELKKINVNLIPEQSGISLESDSYYLQRVFENLFSNALKFSKIGTEVTVSSEVVDESVIIKIRNFGEGIKQC